MNTRDHKTPPDRRELERRIANHATVAHNGYKLQQTQCAACTSLWTQLCTAIEREAPQDDEMERSRFERKGEA